MMKLILEWCEEVVDWLEEAGELFGELITLIVRTIWYFFMPVWIVPYLIYRTIKEMKEETNIFSSHFPDPYGRTANESFEIKPCPFCGGIAHLHIHDRYGIECEDCGMGLGCIKDTPEEAIEAWNRRCSDGR